MTMIAQISDPHLRDDGADPCHDPGHALSRAFEEMEALDCRPDAILLTGDIVDRSAAIYQHALPLLRMAPAPLLPIPGNHDTADGFRAAFENRVPLEPDHLNYATRIGDVDIIALDTNLPDDACGVDEEQLVWLQAALAQAQGPTLLALHHPPFKTHAPHLDRAGFVGAKALAALLAESPVCRVIAGHSHRAIQTTWAGRLASTAPAIGHGLSLSLGGTANHRPVASPPGFELHVFGAECMVSHLVLLT